jgi:hypothetical protein
VADVERMAIHRIIRGHGVSRQDIMPGRVFSLSQQEADRLDLEGATADPRQPRERGDGDTTVIERIAEPVINMMEPNTPVAIAAAAAAAAAAAGKPAVAGKNGTISRTQPVAEDDTEL